MGRGLGNSGKPGGHGISAFHWRVRDGLTGKGKEAREHGPSGKRGRQRPESQSCSCPRTGKVASEAGAKGTERVADEHRRVTTTSRRAAGPWREGRGHCGVEGRRGGIFLGSRAVHAVPRRGWEETGMLAGILLGEDGGLARWQRKRREGRVGSWMSCGDSTAGFAD